MKVVHFVKQQINLNQFDILLNHCSFQFLNLSLSVKLALNQIFTSVCQQKSKFANSIDRSKIEWQIFLLKKFILSPKLQRKIL